MSILSLIRTKGKSRAQERSGIDIRHRPVLYQAWPAVGVLLIAPGIITVDALTPHAEMSHAAGLNLDIAYEPAVHRHQPTTLSLSTMSIFGTKGQFSVRIGKKLLDNFAISNIDPQPVSSGTDGDQSIYTFPAGGKDAVRITLMPKVVGKTAATLQYGLDPPVPFSITTLP